MVIDYSLTINRFTELDAYPLSKIDHQVHELAKCKLFSTLDLKSAYYQIPLDPKDRVYTAFEANGKLYQYRRLPFGVTNGVSAFQRIIDGIISQSSLQWTYAYLHNITVGGTSKADHDQNLKRFLDTTSQLNLTFNEAKSVVAVPQIDILGYRVSQGLVKPDLERLRPLMELPVPQNHRELKRCLGMFAYYAQWIKNYSGKVKPLTIKSVAFPLSHDALAAFERLRSELLNTCLGCIDEREPFTVECDASDFAIAATLNQNGKPVAFMSRTLSKTECNYPTVKKETTSIIEAVRKWDHFLYGKPFTLITDQRSLAFTFGSSCRGKIKNAKIQAWRAKLGMYTYHVQHSPGSENAAADALSRVCGAIGRPADLSGLHESLGHPGITRFLHFICSKNLTFSIEEVRQTCAQCTTCSASKPRFYQPPQNKLIRAT